MMHFIEELTADEPPRDSKRVSDSPQHYFVTGWMEFSSHVKQRIVELRESTYERDTMAKLDDLYKFCQDLEKQGFGFMPTVISEKKK